MIRAIQVTRAEVECGSLRTLLDGFQRIVADPPFARSLQGAMTILFEGYDDDPREIEEIPEAIGHLRLIHTELPWLLYFLPPHPTAGTIMKFSAAFGGVVRKAPDPPGGVTVAPTGETIAALSRHLVAAAELAGHLADMPGEVVQRLLEPFPALAEAVGDRLG